MTRAPDWPPAASAIGRPAGERAYGSTGQLFESTGQQWVRVETARVACDIVNGISVRLMKPGFDDGTGDGVKPMIHDGAAVTFRGPSSLHAGTANSSGAGAEPVVTEVDAGWWARWLEQNEKSPIVTGGHLRALEEDEGNPTP